jgi:hypothetical protein
VIGKMVSADEIRWTPFTDAPLEQPSLDEDDLLVEAIIDALSYREALQVAMHQLHDRHLEHERLRASHARLLDEYRHLRAQTMLEPAR